MFNRAATLVIGMWQYLQKVLIFNTSAMYFVKTNGNNDTNYRSERVLIFITSAICFQIVFARIVHFEQAIYAIAFIAHMRMISIT